MSSYVSAPMKNHHIKAYWTEDVEETAIAFQGSRFDDTWKNNGIFNLSRKVKKKQSLIVICVLVTKSRCNEQETMERSKMTEIATESGSS